MINGYDMSIVFAVEDRRIEQKFCLSQEKIGVD